MVAVPSVTIAAYERSTGITAPYNIEEAIDHFHTYGFVILEDAIELDVLEKLSAKMQADAGIKRKDPDTVFNQGVLQTNFSMPPPLEKEFLFESIWANKHAVAVMEHLIGPTPKLAFASANVLLPTDNPSARQAVHIDTPTALPSYPLCVQASLYLSDVTATNGSTELWPTSHLQTTPETFVGNGRGWIKSTAFNKAARTYPPIQPVIPAGSILLRDLRTWHSGMPNFSYEPRIMLTFTYFPKWYNAQMGATLPADCQAIVKKWTHVNTSCMTFVEGEIDYLGADFERYWILNYSQDPYSTVSIMREEIDLEQGREPHADIEVTKKNYWVKPRTSERKRKLTAEREVHQISCREWNKDPANRMNMRIS